MIIKMNKNRVEAFSDGVIAIIITIMVLELRPPHTDHLSDLLHMMPIFLNYALSFVLVSIYWNNHHSLFHLVENINSRILWANMHLLFWLSLVPFTTAWSGDSHFATEPVAVYGAVLLCCAIAFYILTKVLLASHTKTSNLFNMLNNNRKGILSISLYVLAIPLAYLSTGISLGIYVVIALIWIIPNRREEKQ